MKNKGFTLVELLAVIIVLGILVVIIVPKVSKVLDEQQTKADKIVIEAAQKAYDSYIIENEITDTNYVDSSTISGLDIDKKGFDTIYVKEGKIFGKKGDVCYSNSKSYTGQWKDIEKVDCNELTKPPVISW